MKRKTKKLFSALMALAMLLSLCTFASAATYAIAAGSDSGGNFSAVGAVTGAPAAAAELDAATVAYTADDTGALTAGAVSASGWTASFTGDLNGSSATLTLTKSSDSVDIALTVAQTPSGNAGVITLGAATAEAAQNQNAATTVTLGAGSDNGGNFSAVSGVADADASASELASATVAYTVNSSSGALTAGTISAAGWSAAFTGDLNGASATLTLTKSSVNVAFTLTVKEDGPSGSAGVITLGRQATDGLFESYSEDSADGTVRNEGGMPDNVINVKVPTQAMTREAFDLYLDPHELLKRTDGARYATTSGGVLQTVTLTGDKKVYFKTADNTFSNVSRALTITNKSNVAIGVDLTVEVDKSSQDFTFVDSASALDNEEGAAIYLAVQSGSNTGAVSNEANDEGKYVGIVETSVDTGNWYDMVWHSVPTATDLNAGYYSWDMKESVASGGTFKDLSFNLTSAINDKDAWDTISTFPLTVTWNVKAAAEVENNGGGQNQTPASQDADPDVTNVTKFTGAGTTLTIALDWGSGSKAKSHALLTTNLTAVTATADSPAATLTATAPSSNFGTAGYNQLQAAATVTFYETSADEADAVTVDVTIK